MIYRRIDSQEVPARQRVRVDYNSRREDTDNAVTTGSAWEFRPPIPGLYHVSASVQFSGLLPSGCSAALVLERLAPQAPFSEWEEVSTKPIQATDPGLPSIELSTDVRLNTGDRLWLSLEHSSGGSRTIGGRVAIHYLRP